MGQRVNSGKFTLGQVAVPLKALLSRLSFFIMICASVAVIIIGKSDSNAFNQFRLAVVESVTPVLKIVASPIDAFVNMQQSFSHMMFVHDQNVELRKENDRLLRIQALAERLETENRKLRELMHFIPDPNVSYISARIVTDTGGPYARSAIINAGANDRVRKGQVVINNKGLVGRIAEVSNNSARILLITDINSKVPVITTTSGERAILAGNNSNSLFLTHLPIDTKVAIGERVVTSGDGEFFPAGVAIGTVQSVSNKGVVIKPFVEWNRLEYVSIADYKSLSPQ